MADNFGLKIGLEGEKEFKKALREINQDFKVLGSEMKLVASQFDKQDNSIQAVTARNKVLNREIDEQKDKISLLEKALKNSSDSFGETDSRTKLWAIQLNNAKAELNDMERELGDGTGATDQLGGAMEDGEGKASKFGNALKEIGSVAGKAVVLGLKATAAAIAAIGTAAVTAGKMMFDLANKASDLGEAQNVVSATFDNSGDSINKWAGNLAAAYGISQTEGTKMVGTFGAILKGSGLAEEQFSGMSQRLTELTGDFASFYNIEGGAAQVADDFKSALAGSSETLQKYGIIMNNATLNEFARQQGLNKTFEQMSQAEKQQLRYNFLVAKSSDVTGDFARTAGDSLSNQLRIAKLQLEDIGVSLGMMFMPAVQGAVSGVSDVLNTVKEALADGFQPEDIKAIGAAISEKLIEGLQQVSEFLPTFIEIVSSTLTEVVNVLVALLPKLLPVLLDGAFSLLNGLITAVLENIEPIAQMVISLLTSFAMFMLENLPLVISAGMQILVAVITGIAQAIPELIPAVVEAVLTIVRVLIDNLPMLIQAAFQLIKALAIGLIDALPRLIQELPKIIQGIIDFIVDNLPLIIQMGIELTVQLAVGLVKAIPELVKALPKIIVAIVNGLGEAIGALWEVGKDMVRGIWEGIKSMADWIWQKVKGFFSGIVNGVKDFLGIRSPSTVFAEVGDNMGKGIGVGFQRAMNSVKADMYRAIPTDFDINANVTGNSGRTLGRLGTNITQNISVVTPKALSERELSRELKNLSRKLALEL